MAIAFGHFVLLIVTPLAAFYFRFVMSAERDGVPSALISSAAVSIFSYFVTVKVIPVVKPYNLRAGLGGFDINKKTGTRKDVKVPESLGIVSGTVCILCIMLFQVHYQHFNEKLNEYNAGMVSICFMLFLGFADDVLDLPWRYKLILPTIATLPLIVSYSGTTTVIVPLPLRVVLGRAVDLGIFYKVYFLLFSVFCTNSINIYAGINGLEAGQTLVIACSVLVHNLLQLSLNEFSYREHLLSVFFILPFIATTLGLLRHNWYPSQVFVGDTFTYSAGMTLTVVAINGHFSKTMMLFFVPQVFNFLYSLPQILGVWHGPCPRHRLPTLNAKTGKLEGNPHHKNLVNLFLRVIGPTTEEDLSVYLILFQIFWSGVGFVIRYQGASLFYEYGS